jgi:hypothetical protein
MAQTVEVIGGIGVTAVLLLLLMMTANGLGEWSLVACGWSWMMAWPRPFDSADITPAPDLTNNLHTLPRLPLWAWLVGKSGALRPGAASSMTAAIDG